MLQFFAVPVTDEWGTTYQLTGAGYTALVLIMLVLFLTACLLGVNLRKPRFSTKQLVFSAMAIAVAMITSSIKLYDPPMGGSVTLLSMFFICLIGYWYGPYAGLLTALSYGFLQLISNPYIISLPQMLVDYIFAFGALGLSGLFHKAKQGLIKGYLIGVLGRYFFTFLSGMIFFGVYAADWNMTAPVYSLLYNGAYIGGEALLTLIVLALPPVKKAMGQLKSMATQ